MQNRAALASLVFTTSVLLFDRCDAVSTVIFDVTDDWNDSLNPNGVWSLVAGNLNLPAVADMETTGLDSWSLIQPGFNAPALSPVFDLAPAWFRATGSFTGFGQPVDWLAGDIVVHTSRNDSFPGAVVWTSPGDGTIDVAGAVWEAREIGRSNNWTLDLNSSVIASGTISSGDAFSRNAPQSLASGAANAGDLEGLSVLSGDSVRLEFQRIGSGEDYVGVDFSVAFTPIPEGRHTVAFGLFAVLTAVAFGRGSPERGS